MSGHRCTMYFPPDLALAARIRSGTVGYRSLSAYITGLIRRDVAENGSHDLPLKIAGMGGANRDRIDVEILKACLEGGEIVPLDREAEEREKVVSFMADRRNEKRHRKGGEG